MTDPTDGPRPVPRYGWEHALRASNVKGTRLLVLLVLATYMDHDGSNARPSQETLAEAAGLTDRAVRSHLAAAVKDGWLIRTSRGGRRGDGTSAPATHRASVPVSTGIPVPVENASQPEPVNTSTGTPVPVETPQPEPGRVSTGTPVPPTNNPPTNTPPPRTHTTHDRRHVRYPREEPVLRQGQRVTRRLLWEVMAWRTLAMDREAGDRTDLPPPRSKREAFYLEALEEDFANQHDEKAQRLQGRLPAKDLERWIYELAPTLARFGWGPVLAQADVERRARDAEMAARMEAMTDDDKAECLSILAEARANVAEVAAERRRADRARLRIVPEAS